MRKFTIFTVILTIIIVVVVADVVATEYLPRFKKPQPGSGEEMSLPTDLDLSEIIETNVLGGDVDFSKIPSSGSEVDVNKLEASEIPVVSGFSSGFDENGNALAGADLSIPTSTAPSMPIPASSPPASTGDFEDDNFVSLSVNANIRDDMVRNAGFVEATLETEPHNGFLYKSIYLEDLNDVDIKKHVVKSGNSLLAKVYIFNIGPLSSVNDTYDILKLRASQGIDIELNESNDFGEMSFFMNDDRRASVAFLTVNFGNVIYGFSYPKNYHPQIKNLITLIDMEF